MVANIAYSSALSSVLVMAVLSYTLRLVFLPSRKQAHAI